MRIQRNTLTLVDPARYNFGDGHIELLVIVHHFALHNFLTVFFVGAHSPGATMPSPVLLVDLHIHKAERSHELD